LKKFLLGIKDYENHTSDEGWQLQQGLKLAGYDLWGARLDNDSTDCEAIAAQNPDIIVMIDKREWDATRRGAFDKTNGFTGVAHLRKDNCRFTILKDAGTGIRNSRDWAQEFQPHGYIVYYHPDAVAKHATWATREQLIRTYHSIDVQRIPKAKRIRDGAMVSGARNPSIYPLRQTCFDNASQLGLTVREHPGYSNCGTCTPHFLDALNTWKVHVCCASKFGFALRKIIESVACGCTPITDLPFSDKLPEIDGALIRVPTHVSVRELKQIIRREIAEWNFDRAMYWAEKAKWYDYKLMGMRLDYHLETFAMARMAVA
jgi:hypothetical protein